MYILYSVEKDLYYVGSTCDTLSERIRKHNSNHKGFTGRANDWQLKYAESYPDKSAAYRRELEVKGWNVIGNYNYRVFGNQEYIEIGNK